MRRAFTLIELLVVIAIVAILAAILFPVFAQAKRAAKDSTTISNLKQLGTAFALYEGDHDDVFPAAVHSVGGERLDGGWVYIDALYANPSRFDVRRGSLFPYVKSAEVYRSPLDKDASKSGLSFAFNSCLSAPPLVSTVISSISATAVPSPAGTMLLGEEAMGEYDTDDGYFFHLTNSFAEWHAAGSATLFVDSHAKIFRAKDRRAEILWGGDGVCWSL